MGAGEGVPSVEADDLASAHRRIAQLEAELKLTREACELFDEQLVISPKGNPRSLKDSSRVGPSGLPHRRIEPGHFHRLRKPALSLRFLRRMIVADEIRSAHLRQTRTPVFASIAPQFCCDPLIEAAARGRTPNRVALR
jgi:hypothetical protein